MSPIDVIMAKITATTTLPATTRRAPEWRKALAEPMPGRDIARA
ncbi:MAG TPA: hypothetical protein VII46_00395 [Acidimicrobiales bacterium]